VRRKEISFAAVPQGRDHERQEAGRKGHPEIKDFNQFLKDSAYDAKFGGGPLK